MEKGTSKLRNVQTLVLGARHGIVINCTLLFQRPYENARAATRLPAIDASVDAWRAVRTERPVQLTWQAPGEDAVFDSRTDAGGTVHVLDDQAASVLRACSAMASVRDLEEQLHGRMRRSEIERAMDRLDRLRLLVRREFALSIVLPDVTTEQVSTAAKSIAVVSG